jgi:hypothetical protein
MKRNGGRDAERPGVMPTLERGYEESVDQVMSLAATLAQTWMGSQVGE